MRRLAGLLLIALCLIGVPVTAYADEDDWSIPRYAVTAVAASDGTVDVTLDFDFDFADTPGHGPYVTLPTLQEIDGDPDHYRSFPITDIRASSSTGAPARVDTEKEGRAMAIRVGREDVEVEGRQSYQLSYRIAGLVNPRAGASGQDEIFWNVIGQQWEVPLRDVTVSLTGPVPVGASTCYVGRVGSTETCASTSVDGSTARYAHPSIEPGSGLTVVAGWPAGTFVGAEPLMAPRRNLANTFSLNPLTGILAGAIAVLGVSGLVRRAHRSGRDRQYLGLTPGVAPASGAEGAATGVRDRSAPVAVQFAPPAGVRAGELGTLLDEVAHPHDVTATIVDLAVRGHLRIEEIPESQRTVPPAPKQGVAAKPPKGPGWRLVRTAGDREPTPLLAYEQLILDRLFSDADEVELDHLGASFAGALDKTQEKLYEAVTERGWFAANPSDVRGRWYGIGVGIFLLGAALATVLAITLGWGLIGVAVALVGVVTLAVAHLMPARTAAGTAVLAQALGFKTYLETAEADQLRFEEGEDLFSRYLPYAIAFGIAERWAKVFAELAQRGRPLPEPTWYVGPYSAGFFASGTSFTESLGAFSEAATTSMSTATAGTSGGSGFSGGSAGGGVGGGGGGGW